MTKLSRKELRRELKELVLPVMKHIRTLTETGKVDQVFEYEHRENKIQVQLHPDENGVITVYVLYWYCEAIGFKITPEQLSGSMSVDLDKLADQFVDTNEELIGRVYRGKGKGH